MRYFFMVCLSLAIFSNPMSAQDTGEEHKADAYVFAAPGVRADRSTATIQIGGGGEAYIYKGFGIGADGGVLIVSDCQGCRGGLLSLNAIYRFKSLSSPRLNPFVTAGVSGMFPSDVPGGINFGGGVQYWFARRAGVRIEFRDHVFMGNFNHHYYQGRIGVAFR